MIHYTKGNLLEANTEALVNTVNTVGVMGKGIALQFKEAYPHNYKVYRDACKNGSFKTGEVLAVKDQDLRGEKWIINFPTKAHWKGKSQYSYIESGLKALKRAINSHQIKSMALPPLGCGNGGLEWGKVREMIAQELKDVEADIIVYEPNDAVKKILQKETEKKETKLTPARAMLLYMMFYYEAAGERSSLFVANKLAYFLQRSGEKMRLKFEQHHYGPYTVQLNHVLYYMNGTYIWGLEQNEAKPFEELQLNYEKLEEVQQYVESTLSMEQRNRLKNVLQLIKGFESAFSLELLSTVDYLLAENKDQKRGIEEIKHQIADWSSRKTKLFKDQYVEIAINHLKAYSRKTGALELAY